MTREFGAIIAPSRGRVASDDVIADGRSACSRPCSIVHTWSIVQSAPILVFAVHSEANMRMSKPGPI
jgi:hypothetical protein